MPDFFLDSPLYLPFGVHCLLGMFAAVVAQNKGRRLGVWLAFGLVGGTFALIAAIALKPQTENLSK